MIKVRKREKEIILSARGKKWGKFSWKCDIGAQ